MCKLCELKNGAWSSRRGFVLAAAAGAVAVAPALAQVDVGNPSKFRGLVSADQIEAAALQQYPQMMDQARAQKALAPDNNPN